MMLYTLLISQGSALTISPKEVCWFLKTRTILYLLRRLIDQIHRPPHPRLLYGETDD
ncbi:hypothetical protein NC653_032766 [Populus alba x Populus x berolinensis]|uniref:Uncharacterized protein n=1 Tax=Populus alba x Populus x berolinensis TaxID=444605 RepID=A0AAD6Q069_9ROSI|nr:hypothetical protein NC653_032766 [Populus alba x Populus x berolinensis]